MNVTSRQAILGALRSVFLNGQTVGYTLEEIVNSGRAVRFIGAAEVVIPDRAQQSPGAPFLEASQRGNLPGIGMTIIDGVVRTQRSRNTPPATTLPEIIKTK